MNKLSVDGTNMWMYSNMISEYNSRPNPDFKESLRYQITDFVQDEAGEYNQ